MILRVLRVDLLQVLSYGPNRSAAEPAAAALANLCSVEAPNREVREYTPIEGLRLVRRGGIFLSRGCDWSGGGVYSY